MWPSPSLFLPFLALRLAAVNAQALQTIAYGPAGICPVPAVTSLVVVQPAYYSTFFESASQINNIYGMGNTVMINDGPTTYMEQTYITTTVVSTVTTTMINSATSITSSTPSSSGAIASASSTTPPSGSATSTTTPAVIGQTLGAGVPSGIVTTIPSTSPVLMGAAGGVQATPAKVKRQDGGSAPTAASSSSSAAPTAGALLSSDGSGDSGGATDNCGYATRFYMSNGMLLAVGTNNSVGRNFSDTYAVMTPTPYDNDVNTTFYFNNGILGWNTTDRGPATFYQCGDGSVYAGFPDPPSNDCNVTELGGIGASACPVDYTPDGLSSTTSSVSTSPSTTATMCRAPL
ncbi:hypothetical protein LTR10_016684 [Elasticomyces elasticus]|nr:hypothetical protein LTR10_016684 [Elasticomyces elasticus]